MTAVIEIYTRPGCGYCSAAKSLLTRKKAAFTEYDVAKDPNVRQAMYDRAGARSASVPPLVSAGAKPGTGHQADSPGGRRGRRLRADARSQQHDAAQSQGA